MRLCHFERWMAKNGARVEESIGANPRDVLRAFKDMSNPQGGGDSLGASYQALLGFDRLQVADPGLAGVWGLVAAFYRSGPHIFYVRSGFLDLMEKTRARLDGPPMEMPFQSFLLEFQRPLEVDGRLAHSVYVLQTSLDADGRGQASAIAICEGEEDRPRPSELWSDRAQQTFLSVMLAINSSAIRKDVLPPCRPASASPGRASGGAHSVPGVDLLCIGDSTYWDCGRGLYLRGDRNLPVCETADSGRRLTCRHWVMGHFKSQPCGRDSRERRDIFVEPYIRGPVGADVIHRARILAAST